MYVTCVIYRHYENNQRGGPTERHHECHCGKCGQREYQHCVYKMYEMYVTCIKYRKYESHQRGGQAQRYHVCHCGKYAQREQYQHRTNEMRV